MVLLSMLVLIFCLLIIVGFSVLLILGIIGTVSLLWCIIPGVLTGLIIYLFARQG